MENDKGNDSVLIVIYDRGSFHTTQQGAFHKQLHISSTYPLVRAQGGGNGDWGIGRENLPNKASFV